jgi:hypothetical protein
MQEVYKAVIDLVNNKENRKVIKMIIVLFVFIAPSTSYIFIYKRELFLSLEFFKYLIICLTSNLVFIIVLFSFVMMCNYYKIENMGVVANKYKNQSNIIKERINHLKEKRKVVDGKNYDEFEKELDSIDNSMSELNNEILDISKRIDTEIFSDIIFDVVSIITIFTVFIWTSFFLSKVYDISYGNLKMSLFIFLFSLISYIFKCALDYYNMIKSEKIYNIIYKMRYLILFCIIILIMLKTIFN